MVRVQRSDFWAVVGAERKVPEGEDPERAGSCCCRSARLSGSSHLDGQVSWGGGLKALPVAEKPRIRILASGRVPGSAPGSIFGRDVIVLMKQIEENF